MSLRILDFSQELETKWDQIVFQRKLPLTYSYSTIDYLAVAGNKLNLSFLAIEEGKASIVPILLSRNNPISGSPGSFHDSQLIPVVDPDMRIKSKKELIEILVSRLIQPSAKLNQIIFEARKWCNRHENNLIQNWEFENTLNLVSNDDFDLVVNFCDSDQLTLRRNHIRSERKSLSLGDEINIHSSQSDQIELAEAFERFIDCFEKKTSQPASSKLNDLMLRMLLAGKATLFESTNRGHSKSFLFCDSNGVFARGWRQVNSLAVASNENPRVMLEKTAIEYFRSEGFCSYHLGEIINDPVKSNPKLDSINHFKLGFNPQQLKRLSVRFDG